MTSLVRVGALLAACAALAASAGAQERGAPRLAQLVAGLTVTPRVLIVGAHPDDDDPQLMTWLARGRSVQTAYLSLTRGEAGQNWAGPETGGVLGAVRTRELLAARRIDGGELYFTRAVDFGTSKNAEDAFKHWPHDDLLADLVAIVRAFRPHVIVSVFPEKIVDGDGQHEAAAILTTEVFGAANDATRFPASDALGAPWQPLKLYRRGRGIELHLTEFDPVSGRTLADVAVDSRSQHRSQGLSPNVLRRINLTSVVRVSSKVNEHTPAASETSMFDGIDTSFARLAAGAPSAVADAIPRFIATVDSVRRQLDLARPEGVVPLLARATQLATTIRSAAAWCRHPSVEATLPSAQPELLVCDGRALDLEASIDLAQRRTGEALLLAAGVAFETSADRELIAATDTAPVWLTMFNRGKHPATILGVAAAGAPASSMRPNLVPPDSIGRTFHMVTGLANPHPWWLAKRKGDLYTPVSGSLDGIERDVPDAFSIAGVAVPEGLRRASDITVTVEIEGATVTRSLGPVIYRHADPVVGVQERAVAGAPAVSLSFERNMEWLPASKPIARQLRLAVKSYSDRPQPVMLNLITPNGVRIDSVTQELALAPKEQRELFLRTRSVLDTGLYIFGAIANAKGGTQFANGFKTLQYTYLEPLRFFRTSGVYLRVVDVIVPPSLNVVYVAGSGDDTPNALKGVGVSTAVVAVEDLLAVDLSKVTTLVIGPGVYDAYPQLIDQSARFVEFARAGGTVVVLQHTAIPSRVLPYPIVVARPAADHVTAPSAPVALLDAKAKALTWPNAIRDGDWKAWATGRARYVPAVVDPRWTSILEMHDPGGKPNRNSILIASVGKGVFLYTALTLTDQIDAGVPGALRLLVNLMSAGVSPAKPPAAASR